MKLKTLDRVGLLIIFILGGLFGFTDYYAPRDIGTFLGSAMVVSLISIGIGWVLNKTLSLSTQYKQKTEKINATIAIGAICSMLIFIYGVIEFVSY